MYRRTTLILTVAALLMALFVGWPGSLVQARPKKSPSPSDSPSASASSSASSSASASPASATPTPTPSTPPTTNSGPATPMMSAIRSMSKIQTLVEFYFMSTGTYPLTLDELTTQYNNNAPKDAKKVTIPNDPATNKPFIYSAGQNGESYVLKVPDPSQYGVKVLEVSNIDWGWMRSIADERKKDQLTALCSLYVKGLAQALDSYARDHKNELPDTLEPLVPKLVKKLPVCPVCGKPYIYRKTTRGYEVACPDPKSHDLEVLEYSSTEGFKRR